MRVSLPISTVGCWFGGRLPRSATSTWPAAYPKRMTNSGVIGDSPTLPRTPSVPKYLRPILLFLHSIPDGQRIAHGRNIVYPEQTRATRHGCEMRRHAGKFALLDRTPGQGAQHRLARQPRKHRRSEEHTSELQSPKDLVCRL